MKDYLRKAWFFGLGLLEATKEKAEAFVAEMVKRGEITQQESPEAVKQILEKAKETQKAFFDKVKEVVSKAVSEMRLARAADLQALEKRVAALERDMQEMRKIQK